MFTMEKRRGKLAKFKSSKNTNVAKFNQIQEPHERISWTPLLQVHWSQLVFCRMVENTNSKSDIDDFNLMIRVHRG